MINQIDECFKMRGSSGDQGAGTVRVDGVLVRPGADTVRLGRRSKVVVLMEVNTEVWD